MNYLDVREIQVTLYSIICIYLKEEKKLLESFSSSRFQLLFFEIILINCCFFSFTSFIFIPFLEATLFKDVLFVSHLNSQLNDIRIKFIYTIVRTESYDVPE